MFCCPSLFAQALRAAIVAAELPLRGKLLAEATTVFIDQRIMVVMKKEANNRQALKKLTCNEVVEYYHGQSASLFCCPSIISQALCAAMVATELPLHGKLRVEATIFSIDQCILEVLYQCLQTPFVQGLILCCQARIAPCSTRGKNCTCRPRLFCWVRVFDLESGGARCARRP